MTHVLVQGVLNSVKAYNAHKKHNLFYIYIYCFVLWFNFNLSLDFGVNNAVFFIAFLCNKRLCSCKVLAFL